MSKVDWRAQYPATPAAYMRRAREFCDGYRILAASGQSVVAPMLVLAGHAVELALKAYLLKAGWTEDDLAHKVRHNLLTAWRRAQADGLDLNAVPPPWLTTVHGAHDPGKLVSARYPRANTGLVLPGPAELEPELGGLLDKVKAALTNGT